MLSYLTISILLPTIVFQAIIAYQFKSTVHRLCIDDIHLVRGHELMLAMMVLASTLQVFRSIKPANTDVYMLLVECTHLQNPRFPVEEAVKGWTFRYTMTYQDEVTCCNAFRSHYSRHSLAQSHLMTIRHINNVSPLTSKSLVSSQTFPIFPRLYFVLHSQSFIEHDFLYLRRCATPFPRTRQQCCVHAEWLIRGVETSEQANAVLSKYLQVRG